MDLHHGLVRLAALPALLAGSVLFAGQSPTPAPQIPTFKVAIDYVEVDAVVTDRNGNFIRDLKKEDFEVLEDGKPQAISAFSIVDIPVERYQRPLFASRPIEPDVRTNERAFDGRVYVMVIDDLHTNFGRTQRVQGAARQFIEQNLGANDLMAVVHTAGARDASQDFTNSKRLLLAAVSRTMGRKVASATVERTAEYYRMQGLRQQGDPVRDPAEVERSFNARRSLETLRDVAEWFSSVRGRRKTILFVSEGVDYDITDVFNNPGASMLLDTTRQTIAAATRSNVSIYGIDPRGLTQLADETIEVGSFPDDTSLGIGESSIRKELLLSQASLQELSEETGGFAFVNRNNLSDAFDRIVRDNSTYYVLAYYPPSDKPGKFHNIQVRVNRPNVTVRARRGYATPKPVSASNAKSSVAASKTTMTPEVRDALDSPLPISGLTMHLSVAPFKGTAPNASVLLAVEVRGRDLRLNPSDKISLSYVAIDAQGKIRGGNTDTVTMNLTPETKSRVERTAFRILNRLDLPPGRYQIRAAAHDSGGGNVGSVLYDLDVPDFNKAPFSMSGVVLTSPNSAAAPTVRPDEQLRQVLPGPPVATRAFAASEELALFVEIYDNEASKPHKVDISATVTTDEGKVITKVDEVRDSTEIKGARGGYGYTTRLPLRGLTPGLYVLTVSAKSRLGETPPAERQIQFTITR
jgi:VWFA-related protein